MTWAAAVFCSIVSASIIILNVWNWDRRRAMTPAERAAEDEEERKEMNLW